MAEELQLEIQSTLCQASDTVLKAIAKDLKIDISEQRKSTIVCLICHNIDKELEDKSKEGRLTFLTSFRSTYLETSTQTEKGISVEKSQAPEESAEQSTLKTMFESTSVFRRQFKIVGQIGQPNEKDKLTFTSLTRQIDSGLKQGYSEQEIVDGVIRAISAGMILRSYVETCQELSLDRLKKY